MKRPRLSSPRNYYELSRHDRPAVTGEPFVARLPALLDDWFAYVQEQPHAWRMIFGDTGDAEIQAFRRDVQAAARAVLAELIQAQAELSIPEQQREPLAELLRSVRSVPNV